MEVHGGVTSPLGGRSIPLSGFGTVPVPGAATQTPEAILRSCRLGDSSYFPEAAATIAATDSQVDSAVRGAFTLCQGKDCTVTQTLKQH